LQAAAEASALLSAAVRVVNGFGAAGNGPAAAGGAAGGQSAPVGGHPSPGPQAAQAPPAAPSYNPNNPHNPGAYSPTQSQYPAPTTPPVQSFNGAPHPEGLVCAKCAAPVIGKVIRSGSKLWTCPNQQSKGDGHYTKWLD